jgi:lipoprotein-releasing system ATP-binding protein
MSNLLELRDIRKSYGTGAGKVEVLKGITMTVAAGETIALVGASGAGKTTLLHIMGTLDLPTTGTLVFQGEEIFRRSETALASFRNRTIGFVFQFHHLLPEFTALENVMMPGLINRQKKSEVKESAVELLIKVGLGHRLTHRPTELSGGEQQRVAIARALLQSPTLLLADEPTGNLDRKTSDEVHDVLRQLHDEMGITLIIVTHNERMASSMGKIVQLEDGRIS